MALRFVTFDQIDLERNADEIDEAFVQNGCCFIQLDAPTRQVVERSILAAAWNFYALAEDDKKSCSDAATRVGYRSVGIEIFQEPRQDRI